MITKRAIKTPGRKAQARRAAPLRVRTTQKPARTIDSEYDDDLHEAARNMLNDLALYEYFDPFKKLPPVVAQDLNFLARRFQQIRDGH